MTEGNRIYRVGIPLFVCVYLRFEFRSVECEKQVAQRFVLLLRLHVHLNHSGMNSRDYLRDE